MFCTQDNMRLIGSIVWESIDSLASFTQTLQLLQKELPFLGDTSHVASPQRGASLILVCRGQHEVKFGKSGRKSSSPGCCCGLLLEGSWCEMRGQKRAGRGGSRTVQCGGLQPYFQRARTCSHFLPSPLPGAHCLFDPHSNCCWLQVSARSKRRSRLCMILSVEIQQDF